VTDIQQRIADVLRSRGVGDECLVDWSRADRLASILVSELGLTEFICGNERWYSTKVWDLDENEE
jgi:hypothetical protein